MGSRSATGNGNYYLHVAGMLKRSIKRKKKKLEGVKTRYLQHLAAGRKRLKAIQERRMERLFAGGTR